MLLLVSAACAQEQGVPRVVDLALSADGQRVDLLLREEDERYTSYPGRHAAQASTVSARLLALQVAPRTQVLQPHGPAGAARRVRETTRPHELDGAHGGGGLLFDGATAGQLSWCRPTPGAGCSPLARRAVSDHGADALLSDDRGTLLLDCERIDTGTARPLPATAAAPEACRQFIADAQERLRGDSSATRWRLLGADWLLAWRPYAASGIDELAWALHLPTGRRETLVYRSGPRRTMALLSVAHDGRQWWLLADFVDCAGESPRCRDAMMALALGSGERVALPAGPFGGGPSPWLWDAPRRRFLYVDSAAGVQTLTVLNY